MTVIIGFTKNNTIYMGGDRRGSNGYSYKNVEHPKVFKNGEFLIGYTSSFRFGEILQYDFKPPQQSKDITDNKEFMVSKFIPALREALEKGKYSKNDFEGRSGCALIGYRGSLYELQGDWSILESSNKICSVGSGQDFAMGVMFALKDGNISSRKLIAKTVEIVSQLDPNVSEKCDVLELR